MLKNIKNTHTHTHTRSLIEKRTKQKGLNIDQSYYSFGSRNANANGITLVALVVTIVVLLILAGITITYVMGDNSIFNQASKSKIHTEIAKIEEIAQTMYSSKLLENAKNGLGTKVETSQIIKELRDEGYTIEQKAVSEGDITGISLDQESLTMGKNGTAELKVTYEGVEDPFIYYVEVQGKYYKMHSSKGMITIEREASNVTKADFETEEGNTTTLSIENTNTSVVTAELKENTNNIIVLTTTEAEGDATITAKYGTLSSKPCKIKVVEPILPTSIRLNETEYVVTGGQSWKHDLPLAVTFEPSNTTEQGIIWKSDKPEVATVDENGLVKAGTEGGEATITATTIAKTKDGTNLSATCKITTELFGTVNSAKTPYTDSDGNTAQIPDGYAVGTSENVNKVTGGLVAQDDSGNQFVWIPVGDVKKNGTTAFSVTLGRYEFVKDQPIPETPVASADTQILAQNTTSSYYHKELINASYNNTKAKELQKFINNTNLDGGYWLGRYEASNNSGIKSKYDEAAWMEITQPNASAEAQKLKVSGTYQSDLVNSYAWDTAIVFIEKSGHTGYASQAPAKLPKLNTGKSGNKKCNIYDMSLNYYEWSTETCIGSHGCCTIRGGCSGLGGSYTSFRDGYGEGVSNNAISFRTILYRP